jgi:hypothetical protein
MYYAVSRMSIATLPFSDMFCQDHIFANRHVCTPDRRSSREVGQAIDREGFDKKRLAHFTGRIECCGALAWESGRRTTNIRRLVLRNA